LAKDLFIPKFIIIQKMTILAMIVPEFGSSDLSSGQYLRKGGRVRKNKRETQPREKYMQ
jgi:hypothetical protein